MVRSQTKTWFTLSLSRALPKWLAQLSHRRWGSSMSSWRQIPLSKSRPRMNFWWATRPLVRLSRARKAVHQSPKTCWKWWGLHLSTKKSSLTWTPIATSRRWWHVISLATPPVDQGLILGCRHIAPTPQKFKPSLQLPDLSTLLSLTKLTTRTHLASLSPSCKKNLKGAEEDFLSLPMTTSSSQVEPRGKGVQKPPRGRSWERHLNASERMSINRCSRSCSILRTLIGTSLPRLRSRIFKSEHLFFPKSPRTKSIASLIYLLTEKLDLARSRTSLREKPSSKLN